jgi:hypothetical protein
MFLLLKEKNYKMTRSDPEYDINLRKTGENLAIGSVCNHVMASLEYCLLNTKAQDIRSVLSRESLCKERKNSIHFAPVSFLYCLKYKRPQYTCSTRVGLTVQC